MHTSLQKEGYSQLAEDMMQSIVDNNITAVREAIQNGARFAKLFICILEYRMYVHAHTLFAYMHFMIRTYQI